MEMKEILYDVPYQNPDQAVTYDGFCYVDIVSVSKVLPLEGTRILDLFHMTPYAWKTPKEGIARLEKIKELEVTASFRIHIFRRL